jgi:microsomal dipeptidase-like Zn-dependent dipeptidase
MTSLVVLAVVLAAVIPAAAQAASPTRYSLVHGCYTLRSPALGTTAGGPYRMQATALGRYLLYDTARNVLAAGIGDAVGGVPKASESADWRVDAAGAGVFRLVLPAKGRALVASAAGLRTAPAGDAGDRGRFSFVTASGCPQYPEVETNAKGTPPRGARSSYSEVKGLLDAHMHLMAFEFLGGRAHCGRPWHPYGVQYALVDCPDHYPGKGGGAVLENFLSEGEPVGQHDPVGWPTFKDWPNPHSLTHEGSYWKWMERAWRGGLRLYVNLLVDNAVLCKVYPYKKNPCDEMNTVRLEARDTRALQDYIDAQYGGPGRGWFRIVTSPFQARRVIARGKLAVVLGIETSKLFGCGVYNDKPTCTTKQLDDQLNEVYRLGVRDMELVNKFDNAFGGVAGDSGTTGTVTNVGNKFDTGKFFQFQTCASTKYGDREPTAIRHNSDDLVGNALSAFLPAGAAPVYGDPPLCNQRGLTSIGEHLVRGMVKKRMIVDPDHLGVVSRKHLLSILESKRYSGVVSSHSWSTPDAYPRIYRLGGVVTPYAGDSTSFVRSWKSLKPKWDKRFYSGIGYGADMNGFGAQGSARHPKTNPVRYPFRSWDGKVTLAKGHSGRRIWDVNTDGVAQYGLYPDWVEDLRKLAGRKIVADMTRGPEAYLQMWERAQGVPGPVCRSPFIHFSRRGLARIRLGVTPSTLLQSAGQPQSRGARVWRWCVQRRQNHGKKVAAVLTKRSRRVGLIVSTATTNTAIGDSPSVSRLRHRGAKKYSAGILSRRASAGRRYFYGIRGGRIRFTAVAAPSVARSRQAVLGALALAGVR